MPFNTRVWLQGPLTDTYHSQVVAGNEADLNRALYQAGYNPDFADLAAPFYNATVADGAVGAVQRVSGGVAGLAAGALRLVGAGGAAGAVQGAADVQAYNPANEAELKREIAKLRLRCDVRQHIHGAGVEFGFSHAYFNNPNFLLKQQHDGPDLNDGTIGLLKARIKRYLLGADQLGAISNHTQQAENQNRFAAIIDAFHSDAYALSDIHRRELLNDLITKVPTLLAAGIAVDSISQAIAQLVPVIENKASLDTVAALFLAAGPLHAQQAIFHDAVKAKVHILLSSGLTYAELVKPDNGIAGPDEAHAALMAVLPEVNATQLISVVPIYRGAGRLAPQAMADRLSEFEGGLKDNLYRLLANDGIGFDSIRDALGLDTTAAVALFAEKLGQADITFEQAKQLNTALRARTTLTERGRFNNKLFSDDVIDRLLQNIQPANFNELVQLLKDAGGEANLRTALCKADNIAALMNHGITVAQLVAAHGAADAAVKIRGTVNTNPSLHQRIYELMSAGLSLELVQTLLNHGLAPDEQYSLDDVQPPRGAAPGTPATPGLKSLLLTVPDDAVLAKYVKIAGWVDNRDIGLSRDKFNALFTRPQQQVMAAAPAPNLRVDNLLKSLTSDAELNQAKALLDNCGVDAEILLREALAKPEVIVAMVGQGISLQAISDAHGAERGGVARKTVEDLASDLVAYVKGTALLPAEGVTEAQRHQAIAKLVAMQKAIVGITDAGVRSDKLKAFRAALAAEATFAKYIKLEDLPDYDAAAGFDQAFNSLLELMHPTLPAGITLDADDALVARMRSTLDKADEFAKLNAKKYKVEDIARLHAGGASNYQARAADPVLATHLQSAIKALENYATSVRLEGTQWKHRLPGADAEANTSLADIKTKLNELKAAIVRFNKDAMEPAEGISLDNTILNDCRGSAALAKVLASADGVSFYRKLQGIFQTDATAFKNFVRIKINADVNDNAIKEEFRQQIAAVATNDDLNRIIDKVKGLSVGLPSERRTKHDVIKLIVDTLPDVIVKYLTAGITPAQIVAFNNAAIDADATPDAAHHITANKIQDHLLAKLHDEAITSDKLIDLAKAVNAVHDADNNSPLAKAFVQAFNLHFTHLVAKKVVKGSQFTALKALPLLAAILQRGDLAAETIHRYDNPADYAPTAAVDERLAVNFSDTAQAMLATGNGGELGDSVFGLLDQADQFGHLLTILAVNPLSLDDVMTQCGVTDAGKKDVIKAKLGSAIDAVIADPTLQTARQLQRLLANPNLEQDYKDRIHTALKDADAVYRFMRVDGVGAELLLSLGVDSERLVLLAANAKETDCPGDKAQAIIAGAGVGSITNEKLANFMSVPGSMTAPLRSAIIDLLTDMPHAVQQDIQRAVYQQLLIDHPDWLDADGKLQQPLDLDKAKVIFSVFEEKHEALQATAEAGRDSNFSADAAGDFAALANLVTAEVEAVSALEERASDLRLTALGNNLNKLYQLYKRAEKEDSQSALQALRKIKDALSQLSTDHVHKLREAQADQQLAGSELLADISERLLTLQEVCGVDVLSSVGAQWRQEIRGWGADSVRFFGGNTGEAGLVGFFAECFDSPELFFNDEYLKKHMDMIEEKSSEKHRAIFRNIKLARAKIRDNIIEKIAASLRDQGYAGRAWYRSNAELQQYRHQAGVLFATMLELDKVHRSVQQHMQQPVDLAKIAEGINKLKADVDTAIAAKEAKPEIAKQKRTIFSSVVDLTDGDSLKHKEVRNFLASDTTAVGVRDRAATLAVAAVDPATCHGKTGIVALQDNRFAAVNVVAASNGGNGVFLRDGLTVKVGSNAATDTDALRDEATPNALKKPEDYSALLKRANELGRALALAKVDMYEGGNPFSLFGDSKEVEITGNFRPAGANDIQGLLEVLTMKVCIAALKEKGFTVVDNEASRRLKLAEQVFKKQIESPAMQAAAKRLHRSGAAKLPAEVQGGDDMSRAADKAARQVVERHNNRRSVRPAPTPGRRP